MSTGQILALCYVCFAHQETMIASEALMHFLVSKIWHPMQLDAVWRKCTQKKAVGGGLTKCAFAL